MLLDTSVGIFSAHSQEAMHVVWVLTESGTLKWWSSRQIRWFVGDTSGYLYSHAPCKYACAVVVPATAHGFSLRKAAAIIPDRPTETAQ